MATVVNDINAILMAQLGAVQRYFSHARFVWEATDRAFYEWEIRTEGNETEYVARLYFNPQEPEVMPAAFAWSPIQLPDYPSGTINEIGSSHRYHILPNGPDGRVQICHTPPDQWDPSIPHVVTMLKVQMWFEAYSTHLKDGSSISAYFKNA